MILVPCWGVSCSFKVCFTATSHHNSSFPSYSNLLLSLCSKQWLGGGGDNDSNAEAFLLTARNNLRASATIAAERNQFNLYLFGWDTCLAPIHKEGIFRVLLVIRRDRIRNQPRSQSASSLHLTTNVPLPTRRILRSPGTAFDACLIWSRKCHLVIIYMLKVISRGAAVVLPWTHAWCGLHWACPVWNYKYPEPVRDWST